jgi:hypothetical protein
MKGQTAFDLVPEKVTVNAILLEAFTMRIPKLTDLTGAAYVAAHAAKITGTRRKMLSSRRVNKTVRDCKRADLKPQGDTLSLGGCCLVR